MSGPKGTPPHPLDPEPLADRIASEAERQRAGWSAADLRTPGTSGGVPPPMLGAGTAYIALTAPDARALLSVVDRLRQASLVQSWFFVRKPPALRLRFRLTATARYEGDALTATLGQWLRDEGAAFEATPAVYEPEEARFGGATGLELAHRHFQADSDAALAFLSADREVRQDCPAVLLSASLTNDLLGRVVDDLAELYDIWCRLGDALTAVTDSPSARGLADVTIARASMAPDLAPQLPAALHPLVGRVQESNARLAVDVRSARPDLPLRSWAAAVTVFHWNRFGLTTEEIAPLVAGVRAVLQP